jgi:ABC-type branched-subunit amino acid transport system substrate-binding protein
LAGLGCKAAMTASQGFFNGATIKQLGPLADGFLVSSSMPPLGKSAAMSLEIEAYHESYGDLTPMAAFSYAAAQIIITALRRVNAISRAPLSAAIASGGTYNTLVGDFRFDAFGDQADPNLYFYTIKRGAWVAAGSVRPVHFL